MVKAFFGDNENQGIGVSAKLLVIDTHVHFFYIPCAFRFECLNWRMGPYGAHTSLAKVVWGQETDFVVLFPKPRHVWPQFPPIAKRRAASSIANITAGAPAARYTAKALHTRPLWDGDDGDSGSGFSSGSESTTCQGTGNSRKPISFLPSNMGFPLKFC